MSLDVSLSCPTCGHGRASFNLTYNLGPMWRAASGLDNEWMLPVEGKTGAEVLPMLNAALAALRGDPDRFERMNPPNGWGSYDGLVEVLERMRAASKEHPTWKWSEWR